MNNNTIYQYPKCTTCAKALKWLTEEKISFTPIHIVEETPDAETLKSLIEKSGLPLRKFFNTSGKKYRELGLKDKLDAMSLDEALKLLASDGMLIKRPLLVNGETVLIGFNEKMWKAARL
ncbi:MAG: arsenate reductase family protein [Spirochaetales bacterium]|nr:arsenate reductase family protein [Spirochaetales bacterium]